MPKPAPLTPIFLRNLRPPAMGQDEYPDGMVPGLWLRVSAGGAATWVLRCRDRDGKTRRFTVGVFPALGLSDARRDARTLREAVRKGADPVAEARRQREEAAKPKAEPVTLAGLLDAYEAIALPDKKDGRGLRSWPVALRGIKGVFKAYMDTPAAELEAPALQVTVDKHKARFSAAAAVRYLRPVLAWGAKRGLVTPGVAEALDQPEIAARKRDRVLSRDEMHVILRVLTQPEAEVQQRGLPPEEMQSLLGVLNRAGTYRAVLHMLFLTGTRLNEVCGMRWADVDIGTGVWTIPMSKTDRPLTVPLPRQATALLRARLPADEEGQAVDPDPAALVFGTRNGLPLANWDKYTKPIQAASNTEGWHRHDIRRSVATLLGDLGVAPHVVEIVLGHALHVSSDGSRLGGAATVYNTSRYRAEHAEALQRLADELDLIEAGGAKVVRLAVRA